MAAAQAPTVQPGEVVLAGLLIKYLTEAAGSQKPDRAVKEVRRILPSIWTRLQSLAAAEPEDALYSHLVETWREFYELNLPEDRRHNLHDLLETGGESAIGLARLARIILEEKCPNGALGAALLNL
ncbi:hypothetical protein [Spirillospora sp. CA-128828]|uniref:hypothetical protein n=1 Tax=Spirillospora sp. CA-128828 TaxID=3240033 RepID=UPI003D8A8D90